METPPSTPARKKYTLGFLFTPDGKKVALIRKNRPTWQAGQLNGIGGKTEEGESAISCLVREYAEEATIQTIPESWREFCRFGNPQGFEVTCFTGIHHGSLGELLMVEDEEPGWYDVDSLSSEKRVDNLDWLVALAHHANISGLHAEITYPESW